MYYAAEHLHFSGVLAVVSGGLFLSSRRHNMLSYLSRIQGVNVWNTLVFVLNGVVFLLIGLQLPSITEQLGDTSLSTAIWYGLAISLTLIVTRLLSSLGAVYFTRFMSRFIQVADPSPNWKIPIIFGWAGMRGVVSLAAALSIPLLSSEGQAFPYRSLILFITFVVILVTLVFQGLTLPWLIRKLDVPERPSSIPEHKQEIIIQKKIAGFSLLYLEEKYGEDNLQNEHLHNLRMRLETELRFFKHEVDNTEGDKENALVDYQNSYLELLDYQRSLLNKINQHAEFDEDIIRKYMLLIDLEEYKTRERQV
jgi:CPA1 family monovalent cation:H+ antiporter